MKRMLVAIDGSEYGLAAVKAAAKLAAERGIPSVTIINVIPTVTSTVGMMLTGAPPEDIEAWEPFDKPKVMLKETGIEAKLLLCEGDPAEEIVRVAKDEGYDLIVVGHRGLSPAKAFLLGSVSNQKKETGWQPKCPECGSLRTRQTFTAVAIIGGSRQLPSDGCCCSPGPGQIN